jgi:hypothetical protein
MATLLACEYNPFWPPESTAPIAGGGVIQSQRQPEGTLDNFASAYTLRDSVLYAGVLDSSFLFIATDYNQSPPQAIQWGRDEDLRVTARLFRAFQQLQLDWGQELFKTYSDDSTEVGIRRIFSLTLDGGIDIPPIRGEADFRLMVDSDSLWYITRWEDYSSF